LPGRGRTLLHWGRVLPGRGRTLLYRGRLLPGRGRILLYRGRVLPGGGRILLYRGRVLPGGGRILPLGDSRLRGAIRWIRAHPEDSSSTARMASGSTVAPSWRET